MHVLSPGRQVRLEPTEGCVANTEGLEGSELSEVSYEKDLGVWVSYDVKCSKQYLYAFNKATRVLGMIKRTIRFKDNAEFV